MIFVSCDLTLRQHIIDVYSKSGSNPVSPCSAAIGWATSLSFAASSEVTSFGVEDLNQISNHGRNGRSLLQVLSRAPAPAPGPSEATGDVSSGSTVYLSYSVLTANYVPCPPRTGMSYYTPNCASSTEAVSPYTRGCSVISNCARDSG